MKSRWIPFLCPILALIAILPPPHAVSPVSGANSPYIEAHASEIGILERAQDLYAKYGPRPPYKGPVFRKNEALSPDEAEMVLPYLFACESGGRNVSEIDSNGKWSRGPGQYQDKTWAERQRESGIAGAATQAIPAVQMSLWSLKNGYLWQWSCARLLGIVD